MVNLTNNNLLVQADKQCVYLSHSFSFVIRRGLFFFILEWQRTRRNLRFCSQDISAWKGIITGECNQLHASHTKFDYIFLQELRSNLTEVPQVNLTNACSPETVPRTYSHRKQSPKHQFYQPQQHLIKPVSLVEGCDFSRRVELTESLLNHHKKKKRNISLRQLLPLTPRPKSPNLLLSFFPHCPPWCSFQTSSSSLALWHLITVAALSQDVANYFSSSN